MFFTKNGEAFVSGAVIKDGAEVRTTSKGSFLTVFSLVVGKEENGGGGIFKQCKAFGTLGNMLANLRKGDQFIGTGRMSSYTNPDTGRTYEDIVLDIGFSPALLSIAPRAANAPVPVEATFRETTNTGPVPFEEEPHTQDELPF